MMEKDPATEKYERKLRNKALRRSLRGLPPEDEPQPPMDPGLLARASLPPTRWETFREILGVTLFLVPAVAFGLWMIVGYLWWWFQILGIVFSE